LRDPAADLLGRDGTRKRWLAVLRMQGHEGKNQDWYCEPGSSVVGAEGAAEPVAWGLAGSPDLGI
jgi:hypothetical protein